MEEKGIPVWAYRLLMWFCRKDLVEELAGDLEESFERNCEKYGQARARRIYIMEVLRMLRPGLLGRRYYRGNHFALFSGYVMLALRNIHRHRLFSFINILSLAIAMSAGLVVIGMITELLQYDEFHTKKDQIYRVISHPVIQGRPHRAQAVSPFPLGTAIEEQVPGIALTQLARNFNGTARINKKALYFKGIYADESFFEFLTFHLAVGNEKEALKEPFSVILSESFVEKTFAGKSAVGELMEVDGLGTFRIAGIAKDPPKFSHIQFEAIASLSTLRSLRVQFPDRFDTNVSWDNFDRYYNYLLLPNESTRSRLITWLNDHAPQYFEDPDELTASFELQAVNEVVPGPDLSDQIGPKMLTLPIIILSGVSLAILLSAIFNYTNLSMARALRRAREVGVRKLNGAGDLTIYLQFTMEAVVLAWLALALGVAIFLVIRPGFLDIVPRASELLNLKLTPQMFSWFFGFATLAGLLAGLAPSLFFFWLSSLRAISYRSTLNTLSGVGFRRGLIVAQFTLSTIFVLAVLVVHRQYAFSLAHDLGLDRENVLNITLQQADPKIVAATLRGLSTVNDVSFSDLIPGTGGGRSVTVVDDRTSDTVWTSYMMVDARYLPNHDIALIAGRNFRHEENARREKSILVNETFVDKFGFGSPEEALGRVVYVDSGHVEVIGVVRDFHHDNLEERISSFIFRSGGAYRYANVRIGLGQPVEAITQIEGAWEEIDGVNPMEARFYDDHIEGYYQFFVDLMKLIGFVGFLAVSIGCMGLFGMALYTTEIRMKEVGIRKAFGASERALILLLSKGFLKMILIAVVIGVPVCYLLFDRAILPLNFYHAEISALEIVLTVGLMLTLCVVTIGVQTWSAARTNPSRILRDE